MNKFLAGAVFYVVIVWILIIIPHFIAGLAMLIIGIKDLKASKRIKKKKISPIVCSVIGAIFFLTSSVAVVVPTIWWIQFYQDAEEADKSYNKRFESSSEQIDESEEVNSETAYLIY